MGEARPHLALFGLALASKNASVGLAEPAFCSGDGPHVLLGSGARRGEWCAAGVGWQA